MLVRTPEKGLERRRVKRSQYKVEGSASVVVCCSLRARNSQLYPYPALARTLRATVLRSVQNACELIPSCPCYTINPLELVSKAVLHHNWIHTHRSPEISQRHGLPKRLLPNIGHWRSGSVSIRIRIFSTALDVLTDVLVEWWREDAAMPLPICIAGCRNSMFQKNRHR